MKIIVLFKLKPSVNRASYETWAKTTDIPGVNGLPSVDRFEVFKTTGVLGGDAKPSYEYVEIIDVNDMDAFGAQTSTEVFQKVAAAFGDFAKDPEFILTEAL
ncbi:MAG: REDY-like protein HapK [Erythrobacter sp.]|uniref:REDY-like protein HapK n=1 Tax=Erythrobacter sp. TaxID=1042 RepID=UPI00329A554B